MTAASADTASNPCSMFGTFNLRSDTDLVSFQRAFNALCEHLRDKEYLVSWRLWERAYHDGYDANFPDTTIVIEMCFHDRNAALESWDYLQSGSSPAGSLHRAVNGKVTDAHFVLCREIT